MQEWDIYPTMPFASGLAPTIIRNGCYTSFRSAGHIHKQACRVEKEPTGEIKKDNHAWELETIELKVFIHVLVQLMMSIPHLSRQDQDYW